MRCDKMHATIAVKQCIGNQAKLAGIEGSKAKSYRYPGCQDCPTGRLARRGKLNDDDLKALLDGYHKRMNPPADVVALAESKVTETAINQDREEAVMEEEKQEGLKATPDELKVCTRCKKSKPIGRFPKKEKGGEKRRPHCNDCEAAYQRERKAKIRERKSDELKREPQNIEQETAEPQKVKAASVPVEAPEKQVEPAPRQEIPAPVVPQDEDQVLENQLLLDFSCYPEVLKEIKRIAHHEERPPEVQARFMLKRLLMDGWSEDTLAAGGRCPVPLPHYDPMFIHAEPPRRASGDASQCA